MKKPSIQNIITAIKTCDYKELGKDICYDFVGSCLFALGFYTFAEQAGFAPGGLTGISLMIRYFTGAPLGTLTLLLNVPIILICARLLGHRFFIKSMRTMLICTFVMDVIFARLPLYDGEPVVAAVFTGIFAGAGLGIIYMRGSSTGGTDFVLAAIKKKNPHFSFGQITLVLDGIVILMGWPVYGSINAVLYGLISVFATTVVMDKIVYGAGAGKLVIAISEQGAAISKAIALAVDRGSTIAPATGSYTGSDKEMVYCACSNSEVFRIRDAIRQVDHGAIVLVCEASEMFGEGFRSLGEGHDTSTG